MKPIHCFHRRNVWGVGEKRVIFKESESFNAAGELDKIMTELHTAPDTLSDAQKKTIELIYGSCVQSATTTQEKIIANGAVIKLTIGFLVSADEGGSDKYIYSDEQLELILNEVPDTIQKWRFFCQRNKYVLLTEEERAKLEACDGRVRLPEPSIYSDTPLQRQSLRSSAPVQPRVASFNSETGMMHYTDGRPPKSISQLQEELADKAAITLQEKAFERLQSQERGRAIQNWRSRPVETERMLNNNATASRNGFDTLSGRGSVSVHQNALEASLDRAKAKTEKGMIETIKLSKNGTINSLQQQQFNTIYQEWGLKNLKLSSDLVYQFDSNNNLNLWRKNIHGTWNYTCLRADGQEPSAKTFIVNNRLEFPLTPTLSAEKQKFVSSEPPPSEIQMGNEVPTLAPSPIQKTEPPFSVPAAGEPSDFYGFQYAYPPPPPESGPICSTENVQDKITTRYMTPIIRRPIVVPSTVTYTESSPTTSSFSTVPLATPEDVPASIPTVKIEKSSINRCVGATSSKLLGEQIKIAAFNNSPPKVINIWRTGNVERSIALRLNPKTGLFVIDKKNNEAIRILEEEGLVVESKPEMGSYDVFIQSTKPGSWTCSASNRMERRGKVIELNVPPLLTA